MPRSSKMTIIAVIAVAVVATVAFSYSDDSGAEIVAKLDALEKRIASLERTLNARFTALEQAVAKGGSGGGVNQALENEARTAFNKINSLVQQNKYGDAKTEMAAFMTKYGSTNTAKQAGRLNAELSVIGKQAPTQWGIEKWFQGENDIDLGSDATTLLVFWEVWCPHCKREVPKIEKIYNDYKDKGLQVVGLTKVNRSATEDGVKGFITEKQLTYPIAKEDGKLSAHFGVSGVPAAAVVKNGKVVWRGHPVRLTPQMLESWL